MISTAHRDGWRTRCSCGQVFRSGDVDLEVKESEGGASGLEKLPTSRVAAIWCLYLLVRYALDGKLEPDCARS